MTSANYYKQSVFDHASLSLAVSLFVDENLNSNANNSVLSYIRKKFEFVSLRNPNNISDNKLRKIYFNFKQDFSLKEKEWENFQAHHKPFGYLCICEFKGGNDLKKILDFYTSEKEKLGTSIYESRLVFIYNEYTKTICEHIKRTLNTSGEILSSVDSETGEIVQADIICNDFAEELGYIQDYFIQNEIIWHCRSAISVSRINSNNSLNDSTSSSYSNNWKISSLSSESVMPMSSPINSPMKPYEMTPFEEKSFDSNVHDFLKVIFDKLFFSLSIRETVLMSKLEQTRIKHANSEGSSDTGSVLSLDDGEFNLSDPLDQDNKKFSDEKFNKTNRSRLYLGRLNKQTADQSLLCGNYFESYYYYQLAICYLRKANDQLWLAGAEEGLCCSWILYCFETPTEALNLQSVASLHDKSRHLIFNQSKNDQTSSPFLFVNNNVNSPDQPDSFFMKKFSFNDLFKNPPEIQNLDELSEKYHSCISKYKKILINKLQNLYPINFDSIIKASRFFVNQHRFLEAANFLKMIKNDLLRIQNDKEQYHNTLAQLYSQMGFLRKSALHKYKKALIMHTKLSSAKNPYRQQINEQKISVLIEILNDLNVKINDLFHDKVNNDWINLVNDGLNDNGFSKGFQSIKVQIILELYYACKNLNYSTNILLGLGLSILDNWYHVISKEEYEKLVKDLNNLSISKESKINLNASVMNLPRLTKVILSKLPDYLLPKRPSKPSDENSVFIYTPIKAGCQYGRSSLPEPVIWICGEECEIVLLFDNLINIPLQLSDVAFLLTSTDTGSQIWILSEGSSIHYLPAYDKKIHCHFVIVPNYQLISIGSYNITNVSYRITSIFNITFYPHKFVTDMVFQCSLIPEIKLCPMMPQLRIIPSVTEQSDNSVFKLCKFPASTVSCSTLDLYVNEILEFSLFLSNESKELDVDQIVCLLDELDLNTSSNTLISRFADQEFSNKKCSNHRLLSFSVNNLEKCLPIKSISSLKDSANLNCEEPSLPTDAILRFRIDTTNNEFCQELFERSSLVDAENLDILWRGQLKITVQYWSNRVFNCDFSDDLSLNSDIEDVIIVKKDNSTLSNTYRESVCLLNCQLMDGLGLINYQLDNHLNLILSLMNFTQNKMNVEIFWKGIRQSYIVIASNNSKSNLSLDSKFQQRNSSTELFSHISYSSVSSENLALKSMMDNGSIKSEEDLANYIQRNLKISWIMKDKNLDKVRQGFVNLTWCNCYFSQNPYRNVFISEVSLGHKMLFSINDLIKIWMWDNVKLNITLSINNPASPTLPDKTGDTIRIFDGLEYDISCMFKEQWPPFISEQRLTSISLLPSVIPSKISTPSLSSSESDNGKLQRFIFAGNVVFYLQKDSIPITNMSGCIMFLLPGSYNVSCQLVVSNNTDYHKWQTNVLVLVESDKHQVHVI